MPPTPTRDRRPRHAPHPHPLPCQCAKRKRKRERKWLSLRHSLLVLLKRDVEVVVVVGQRGVRTQCTMSQNATERPEPMPSAPSTPTTPMHNAPEGVGGGGQGGQGVEGAEASVRSRRKLENADSSYDSDFDPSEKGEDPEEHGNVCRTVSDTLGAEFAEYVTKYSPSAPPAPPPVTSATYTPPKPPPPSTPPTATTTTTTISTAKPVLSSTSSAATSCVSTTTTTSTVTSTAATSSSTTTTTTTTTTKDTTSVPTLTLTQPTAPKCSTTNTNTSTTTTTTTTTTTSQKATCTTTTTTTTTPTTTDAAKPTYATQVEFGIKLGYSESNVQMALSKLGPTPDINDLLAELIRLGTTHPKTEGGGGGGGEEDREDLSSKEDYSLPQLETQQLQLQLPQPPSLRPVIIDGSNVAMSHGNKTTFSCRGLRVCVDWFRARGHSEITVFVPAWRKEQPRWDTPIADQDLLLDLERERVLVFTPSRVCAGKRIVSYDDRYILNEAVQSGGVVVSNDNYRDLVAESSGFRKVVEESLLMYSWVNGRFVPPDDPLGRSGPTLEVFLRRSARDKDKQAPCPYGRKCTYGNKCKYKHPERGTAPVKSVTEQLQEQAQRHYQSMGQSRDPSPGEGLRGSVSLPVCVGGEGEAGKKPLQRTHSIVPTVSLTLPSALTQDTPTHDHSPTTPATSASSHHHLMPPPLDPLRSATLYKSDPALYRLYPSQPHHHYGSSWGWEGGQGSQAGPYGAHLPLSKQQSDPDPQDNPHRKLHRQLTLNPSYDSRLYKIYGFREPAPEHFPLAAPNPSPTQNPTPAQQGSPSRVGRGEGAVFAQGQGRASPGYSSAPYSGREGVPGGLHTPLTRGASQDGAKHLPSLPPHLYPTYSHPHVTRFASAPDPIWGGPHQPAAAAAAAAPPLIKRLNSTSDTRLNLYGSEPHYFPDLYEDSLPRPPTYAPVGPPPGPSPAPGPVGSRPMSPQGAALHHSPSVSPRGHTQTPSTAPPPTSTFPPPGHEDTRLRVFYHLSQLFPEAKVRGVMALHPEETDPQKICGYLLAAAAAAAAAPGTSRPMSPQHQQAAPLAPAPPYLLQPFSGGSLASPPASHEDARLRAFYHLSQLFPEAEVRAVLARAPDETDTQQFCAALLARRAPPQS